MPRYRRAALPDGWHVRSFDADLIAPAADGLEDDSPIVPGTAVVYRQQRQDEPDEQDEQDVVDDAVRLAPFAADSKGVDGFNVYSGLPDDRTGQLLSVPPGEQFWREGPLLHGTPAGIDLLRANTWTQISEPRTDDVRLRYGGRQR